MSIHKITMIKEDGSLRSSEEYNRLTSNGKKIFYYCTRYDDINGKRKQKRSRQFEKAKDCSDAEKEFLYKNDFSLAVGKKTGEILASDMTLDHLAARYFDSYIKDKGNKLHSLYKIQKRYYGIISPILGKTIITKINKYLYKEFKEQIDNMCYGSDSRKYKISYKNTIHGLVVSILNFGMQEYDLTTNTAILVGRFKKDNTWSEEEERDSISKDNLWDLDIFEHFINYVDDLMYKTLFVVLYYLGLRRGEALALRWVDALDIIATKELKIYKNLTQYVGKEKYVIGTPKTKSSRRKLDVPDIVIETLQLLYEDRVNMYGFNENWFVFGDESPIPKTTADANKDKYMQIADVQRITFHEIRHSFCSYLLTNSNSNINIYDVKEFLGHSSIDTTQRIYAHVLGKDKKKISTFFNDKLIERKNVM